ncbi:MAG TPA: tryptophan--tRNA ligase [Segeticoccus sp.]|nr:tryptophan--tRNA ligase [Segeticoccus sp.]
MTTVSGITPSGRLTLGNHLGALRRFPQDPDGFYFVADLHAMTMPHDPARQRTLSLETAALLLAAGLPTGSVFLQSAVPAHAQLAYLLECTARVGELSRMIQFKEKGGRPGTRASLLTYPCLMAADILLYGAEEVPVGGDQDQHVELTRDVATRFNRTYGPAFVVPDAVRAPSAGRICDLLDPTAKMSKSAPDDAMGVIRLLDEPAVVRRKVMRAVTDSGSVVRHDAEAQPGITNLLEILAACTGGDAPTVGTAYRSYGRLKRDVADAVVATLAPLQDRYAALAADPAELTRVLAKGAERASAAAAPILAAATRAIGLVTA